MMRLEISQGKNIEQVCSERVLVSMQYSHIVYQKNEMTNGKINTT